jgi:hypothetical protein
LLKHFSLYSFEEKSFMSKGNQQQMFDRILQWQRSGLSQKAWCKQNDITYSSFHYWYKRFRSQHPNKKQVTGEGFVELLVQDRSSGTPWCELILAHGQRLSFHQPIPAEFIRSLLG